jgi:hypothetical protein
MKQIVLNPNHFRVRPNMQAFLNILWRKDKKYSVWPKLDDTAIGGFLDSLNNFYQEYFKLEKTETENRNKKAKLKNKGWLEIFALNRILLCQKDCCLYPLNEKDRNKQKNSRWPLDALSL